MLHARRYVRSEQLCRAWNDGSSESATTWGAYNLGSKSIAAMYNARYERETTFCRSAGVSWVWPLTNQAASMRTVLAGRHTRGATKVRI